MTTFKREMELRGEMNALGYSAADVEAEVARQRDLVDPPCCECGRPCPNNCPFCDLPLCNAESDHVESCAIADVEGRRP